MTIAEVIGALRVARIDLSTEKAAQAALAQWLEARGIAFEREHRLSPEDIPDFFIGSIGLAVEVKLRGASKAKIWRQIERYTRHASVTALALVSSVSMGLPTQSNGKPLYFCSLGRAWL